MKRHMALVQQVLEFVEGKDGGDLTPLPSVQGYTMNQVHYHLILCKGAGFISKDNMLTWAGHNELARLHETRQ